MIQFRAYLKFSRGLGGGEGWIFKKVSKILTTFFRYPQKQCFLAPKAPLEKFKGRSAKKIFLEMYERGALWVGIGVESLRRGL